MSWGDFLGYGVGNPPGTLVQFEEARELVREHKLATKEKWQEWCQEGKRPATVPSLPDRTYADEGWLGTKPGKVATPRDGKAFLPFEEARELVRGIGLES